MHSESATTPDTPICVVLGSSRSRHVASSAPKDWFSSTF